MTLTRILSPLATVVTAIWLPALCWAQVHSGSDGHDGVFNPITNTIVNMADHPDGVYHYTSVNVPQGVTVMFIPNANNAPVVWLIQGDCVIEGNVWLSADVVQSGAGPGGFRGGNGGSTGNDPTGGQGPGGGMAAVTVGYYGGNASYATTGETNANCAPPCQASPGQTYGNRFLVPLLGGSGGGGARDPGARGGNGGGAILIAASGAITLNGNIESRGGGGEVRPNGVGGGGSGGAVRLVARMLEGRGIIDTRGGLTPWAGSSAGSGRVRLDALDDAFAGAILGALTRGFQPVIFPTAGQGASLTVMSVAGVPVTPSPTGQLATPDVVLAAQQLNPIAVVVRCLNVPLNTAITVSVKPAHSPPVSALGYNTGTLAESTATVLINMPRGGGLMYATAATSK